MPGIRQMASGKHRRRQSALTPRVTTGLVKYHPNVLLDKPKLMAYI
jgi:hypothetical protein